MAVLTEEKFEERMKFFVRMVQDAIEKLRARNVLDDRDVQDIIRMEPFAVLQP